MQFLSYHHPLRKHKGCQREIIHPAWCAPTGQQAASPGQGEQSEPTPWGECPPQGAPLEGAKAVTINTFFTMAQSLCKIYLHLIFHIKTTSPEIKEEHLERVHSYIGQLVNTTGCQVVRVGGTSNHVHVICTLSREVTVAHLVEELKRNSSRWIKTIDDNYKHFAWQNGYAVFSVSQSVIDKTITYVENQKSHHTKVSFREEYLQWLKLYGIEFNEQYILTD